MTAPERIYLQWIEDESAQYIHEGVTWCADRIEDDDVEYVRADIAARATAEQRDSVPIAWMVTNVFYGSVSFHTEEAEARTFKGRQYKVEPLCSVKSQQDAAIEQPGEGS